MIRFLVIENDDVREEEVDVLFPDEYVGPHYGHTLVDEYEDVCVIFNHEMIGDKSTILEKVYNKQFFGKCIIVKHDYSNGDVYSSLDYEYIDYILGVIRK